MKLRTINEIQYKYVTTNLNRNSVCGSYATNAVNDLFHVIFGHDSHLDLDVPTPTSTTVTTAKQEVEDHQEPEPVR